MRKILFETSGRWSAKNKSRRALVFARGSARKARRNFQKEILVVYLEKFISVSIFLTYF